MKFTFKGVEYDSTDLMGLWTEIGYSDTKICVKWRDGVYSEFLYYYEDYEEFKEDYNCLIAMLNTLE